ncbi:MAG: LysR family transcriptional regulator [Rubrimonas sp.]
MAYLDNLRVFVRVYELGNLTAAGRDQRVSAAVASNRIKELELHLGVRLFNRTTRKLSPTPQGAALYPHAVKVLDAVAEAEGAVADIARAPRGPLRVTAPLGLGRRVIAPATPDFHAAYPGVQLRLRLSDHRVDMLEEGVDVAFVLGALRDSSMRMRRIMECPRILCAAPEYLARRGAPSDPDALVRDGHACLMLRYAGTDEHVWMLRTPEGLRKLAVSGPFDADDADILVAWAVAGCGIVCRPRFEVAAHLAAGRLVQVLPDFPPPPVTLAALYPHRDFLDPKTRLLIDFMSARLLAAAQRAPETAPA